MLGSRVRAPEGVLKEKNESSSLFFVTYQKVSLHYAVTHQHAKGKKWGISLDYRWGELGSVVNSGGENCKKVCIFALW